MCGPHEDEDKMSKLTNTRRAVVCADAGGPDDFQEAPCFVDNLLTEISPAPSAATPPKRVARRGRRPETAQRGGGQADDAVVAPAPVQPAPAMPKGKIGALIGLLRRTEGASIADMMAATGWQAHSVRGAMSGSIKKALGLNVVSAKTDDRRVYRIIDGAGA